MPIFQRTSIRQKLMLITLVTTGLALILTSVSLVVIDLISFRQTLVDSLTVQAKMIGSNSTAALAFNNKKDAEEILEALSAAPNIVHAVIYTRNGEALAKYRRNDVSGNLLPAAPQKEGHEFGMNRLELYQPIILDREPIGAIYMLSDLKAFYLRLLWYSGIGLFIPLGALFVSFLLLSRLQHTITNPILNMARLMGIVSKDKDYSARVTVHSNDEVGSLAEGLNEMLTRIQTRDTELELHRRHLEEKVAKRTAELAKANTLLLQELRERERAEEQLLHDAFHDALTGLPNRALFIDRLAHVIAISKRHVNHSFAVLFMDIDRFKVINDSLGHIVGDQLLIAIGQRIVSALRPGDTIARLGGDEFAILLEDTGNEKSTKLIVERILSELSKPFKAAGHEVFAGASIGIALNSTRYDRPEQILRDADTAMYHSKAQGRSRYVLFESSMHTQAVERLHLETDLRRAVERNEFVAYYQPILSLKTNSVIGFEALVRWEHPERGIINPCDFLHLAEETGLIVTIDRLMLREACLQMHRWQAQFPRRPPMFVNVNLSNKQILQPDLVEHISQVLKGSGLNPACLKLEITENVIIENPESTVAMLSQLRALGVHLYIDDFGTGYSSLSYLHRLPINGFKIDRSFVRRIGDKGENREIIKMILTLARNLNVDVIAEGIETENQLAQIKALNCEYWQGYLFSRPVDSERAKALIDVNHITDSTAGQENTRNTNLIVRE